jgi:hypothetical protein
MVDGFRKGSTHPTGSAQISRREGPHGSTAPRLLRRTRSRPRRRAILDRGLSADRRNAEVARIEQREIRGRAARLAPDFVSLNPGYACLLPAI